jgi:orotate phosphoribosyltransferase
MAVKQMEYLNPRNSLKLRVSKGHFATSHSHINYYVDLTFTKHRLSEAREAARTLAMQYKSSTMIDTILCLDGTEVVGACMASELTKSGFSSINTHNTIYVVTPEHTTGSQLIFRDNILPMIKGKHVLILAASITTGYTVQGGIEAIQYYGGSVAGISAIFSCLDKCFGYPVSCVFSPEGVLTDYESHVSHECPLCKAGEKVDAIVNTYGISFFR